MGLSGRRMMVKTHARPTIALAPRLAAFSLSSIRSSSLISDFGTGDTHVVDIRLKQGYISQNFCIDKLISSCSNHYKKP